MNSGRKVLRMIGIYVGAIIVVVVVLFPYLWMVSGSFKSTLEIQSADFRDPELAPRWIPRHFTWENYIRINQTVRMLDYFRNSMIISGGTMLASILLSLFAAYSLSRFRFRLKEPYVGSLLLTQMFPGILFLIPYYVMFVVFNRFTGVQLRNSYLGMIFTYTSFALPFSILMLRSFLAGIPREIDEQAQIDGCSTLGIIFRIILPLARPGIAAVAIYGFIMAWNEMLFASVLTGTETKTVAIGLLEFITTQESRWAGMMAASVIVTIPVLILFTFVQKQIIEGLVGGATKG
ncbi:MAG: carbohydrate ABC transporter permease [Atribacterota bacterium]|jgi:multiple sugar transport system permease protein|uniref:Inner membrane ABC transporter permease protein YcjP n=1 Tax=Candidatus Atribacter allofermentans TaxID=1852833 RepID=A0A1V5SY03_9BACT|nr:carbohydrate ABC transporter permease [Atribacterota bacterium]OQA59410.1 MAG: Inner membrane ABC transporter permease protein YcjP [Candidatus Atribacteria bacterium ADurb.Bin276]HOT05100.1 carbohydrate ABC transporter permease [Atribacter sp.]